LGGLRGGDRGGGRLGDPVGVQEVAGDVDDPLAAPLHDQASGVGDVGHGDGLEVFAAGGGEEGRDILGMQHDGHALLGFGQGDLRAVETVVLQRHAVEVDVQRRGELADRDGHAAGAEVIATLDQRAHGLVAEEALQLALGRRVALLHLGGILERGLGVLLRRTRRAAHAVAARAAADEHDDVARDRGLAAHAAARAGGDDRADLHALGDVAGVVVLGHQAGREADLVAVGGIAGGRAGGDLALRELARQRAVVRGQGVGRAGDAHRLVHVGTARQRVADRAAEAGRGAAERLDLGRVVVRLVLEHHQPLLGAPVDLDRHHDGGGVHLLGVLHVIQRARALQLAARDRRDVHQADRLALAVEAEAHALVALPRGLERGQQGRVGELDGLQLGEERRVAAMVGPIRVQQLDLGERRLAAGVVAEVRLAEQQVGVGHRQAQLLAEGGELGGRLRQETRQRRDRLRRRGRAAQGRRRGEVGLARIHRVDQVGLHAGEVGRGEIAAHDVGAGGGDDGALPSPDDLEALGGGVGALVELPREELDGEGGLAGGEREGALGDVVDRRFGEDGRDGLADGGLGGALDVVALEDAEGLQAGQAERVLEVAEEVLGLGPERGFLFDEKAMHGSGPTLVGKSGRGR